MDEEPKCVLCGGDLDIKATIIGCRKCGTVWGSCEGAWVEVKGEHAEEIERAAEEVAS